MGLGIIILSEVGQASTLLRIMWEVITINDYARITSMNQNFPEQPVIYMNSKIRK